jgi:AraC family transcriptional regulator
MDEMGLRETLGILAQPGVRPLRTSAGLGWQNFYLSTQSEQPYRRAFDGAPSHLLILHLDGPVTVRRGHRGLSESRHMPSGGLFLHPADTALDVELGGRLRTVHAYLSDDTLQQAGDGRRPVRLAEEFGITDPLLEQLVLALDGVVRAWEPAARTYADQLHMMIAAQLARRHNVDSATDAALPPARPIGLTDRQFAAVRELIDSRLATSLSLEELAGAAGLSVRQFGRVFKARTGETPHRYLLHLRAEQAARLLRTSTLPIAEIAAACGFSHQEHLTRVLRARTGSTPAVLRRLG